MLRIGVCDDEKITRDKKKQPLVIKAGTTTYSVPLQEICYAENNGRKITLHTSYKTLEFYGKMDDLEQQLKEDFFRSHRGYLVSLSQVFGYDTSNIYLKNGERVYLAKRKYGEFKKAYMQYLKKNTGAHAVCHKTQKHMEQQEELELCKKQIKDMEEYIKNIEWMYDKIRKIRHDMKNYIADMEVILKQRETAETRTEMLACVNGLRRSVEELDMNDSLQ